MSASADDAMIKLTGLTKVFYTDEVETHALSGIHLEILRGEYVAISGPSGCGKSTLLSILGLLDSPTDGSYLLNGRAVQGLNLSRARAHPQPRDRLHLPELQPDRRPHGLRERGAAAHLPGHDGHRAQGAHAPRPSSAWAWPTARSTSRASSRAVSSSAWPWPARSSASPSILLADEPTGNLDSKNGEAVMELLRELHRAGSTICMVTHDTRFARHADRTIHLFDGQVVEENEKSEAMASA